ncbi:PKD domain-containing protein [Syntrophomonas zehnderi]|nr:PKD domain-containing protein [Syntrophomonas zehnderi]
MSDQRFAVLDGQLRFYDPNGMLLWSKPGGTIGAPAYFLGLVVYCADGQIQLLNPNNGQQVGASIPYTYVSNNTQYLYTRDSNGITHVFSQLQGLQYLKQAIENHNWDPDKCNVVVSVIDTDGFKDFEAQKDSIVSLLQAHNLKLAVISPPTGLTKSQAGQMIAKNPEGGWWIQTADDMSIPLSDLAKKIIKAVDEDRGADNIVLVGQDAALRANYQDPEEDPATMMTWSFTHDPDKLGDYELVEKADISTLHDTSKTVVPEENQTTLDLTFDQAGTYKVYCKAQDRPNTTEAYREHEKAGNKWSNQDAYITIIAHYKPVASFTITDTTVNKNVPLSIIDNSYDPDLYNPISQATTDPLNQKGLRCWQWQYKKPDGTWESYIRYDNVPPAINAAAGTYQIRLRVQDVFEAWSDWTETKSFNVVNRSPVADFIVNPNPTFTKLSTTITDKSYDPDGEPIVEYKWEIQKASDQTDIFIHTTPDPFGYTWEDTGSYRVKLTVKDPEGATGTAEKIVVVNEAKPPIARISVPNPVYSGEISLMDGRASTAEAPGSTLEWAYWQYKKPGQDWSDTHTQIHGGNFNLPQERWLMFPIYPADNELGQWAVRLVVVDSLGQFSAPAEKTFTVTEGWEITGQIIPEVGERGRNMRIQAYAHRKGKPNEKYQIDSMKAELAYLDAACTKSGRAVAEGIETLNMPYDASKADFRVTYMVREKIYETNRWPADGMYQIKVIGQKGTTRKEIVLPFSIKGNIHQRFYIQTRSW